MKYILAMALALAPMFAAAQVCVTGKRITNDAIRNCRGEVVNYDRYTWAESRATAVARASTDTGTEERELRRLRAEQLQREREAVAAAKQRELAEADARAQEQSRRNREMAEAAGNRWLQREQANDAAFQNMMRNKR